MKTYQLNDGDKLIFSVNQKRWQTITFDKKDFADISAATVREIASVINRSNEITAATDVQDNLVISTIEEAGNTSLEIDVENSSAGLAIISNPTSTGRGLRAAELISLASEPFEMTANSEMTLIIDGQKRRIVFSSGFKEKKATADEIIKIINAKRKQIAFVTRNGAILLRSNKIGNGSELRVFPAPQGKKDAAKVLGLVGQASEDNPYPTSPASIVCDSTIQGIQAINLTAGPIELHTQEGSVVIPARRGIPLTINDAANTQLQNLINKGVVRLSVDAS